MVDWFTTKVTKFTKKKREDVFSDRSTPIRTDKRKRCPGSPL
jgi:hypothetical protein